MLIAHMNGKLPLLFLAFLLLAVRSGAQHPFTEGKIVYNVRLTGPDKRTYTGTYQFTFKENNLRKELNLPTFQEVMLVNTIKNTVYSLRNINGRKFAIQLDAGDIQKMEDPFRGFTLTERSGKGKSFAGVSGIRATVRYRNGSEADIYYDKSRYAGIPFTFERFPDARFLPLQFAYQEADGTTMEFSAEQIVTTGIDNGSYTIPRDYKVISHDEYLNMK